jgi:hypothetical protein
MRVVGWRAAPASLIAIAMLFAGCDKGDEQIKVYRLAKPSADAGAPETETVSAMPRADDERSTIERVPSSSAMPAPPNWEAQPLSQMRQASFLVHGENGAVADISLVTLGAAAGNALDNVNRWLSQLAQPPITSDKLAGTVQKMPTARGDVDVVDLAGQPENGDASKDGRIVAAMASAEGKISFFKMRGNSALVAAQKENFLKWVSSVRSAAPALGAASIADTSDKPQIKWEVPAGWSPAPASSMRYASFTAAGEQGDRIDISIVTFPGDGGSDADNINRWRQQIGLRAADASTLNSSIVPMKSGGTDLSSIDMTGKDSRLLAAWTRHDGRTWFFKVTGPNAAVEKQKTNFVKFVQSVRF